MFKRYFIFLSIFLFSFLIFANGNQEVQPVSRIITDGLGREVIIPADPTRIILAGRAVIMLADALYAFPEAQEKIVGLGKTNQGLGDFLDVLNPEIDGIQRFGNDVSAEQLLTAQPEVVIMKSFMKEKLGDPLERLGIPVIYVDLETPEQYERDIRVLGNLLGETGRAGEIVEFYKREIEELPRVEESPKTLILYYSNRGGNISFQVPPTNWIQTTMVLNTGAEPIWTDALASPGWNRIGLEQIAAWDPEKIFLISYKTPASEVVANIEEDPAWQELSALKSGEIYGVPGDYYSWGQPDTRWILGQWWIAKRMDASITPEEMKALTAAKARDFFNFLYGLEGDTLDGVIEKIN